MHSETAVNGKVFHFVKLTNSILEAISKESTDQKEWAKILNLMYHLRRTIACQTCGTLRHSCKCLQQALQISPNYTTCREATRSEESGSKVKNNLHYTTTGYVSLCKLLIDKEIDRKWSHLSFETEIGTITFQLLVQDGKSGMQDIADSQNVDEKFCKKVREREHQCRCGSTKRTKRNEGQAQTVKSCQGQRCTCYSSGKKCINCKCIGCGNQLVDSINDQTYLLTGASSMQGPA